MDDHIRLSEQIVQAERQKNKFEYKAKDFQFMDQVGKGMFGIIFKAKQMQSGQILAIKIISKKSLQQIEMYIRLKNQIQIQSRLKFIHICELFCYFHDKNNVYLVLEYCPNGTLYHEVKVKKRYFSEEQIAKYMYQLLLAVDFLHQRFVMHRDIKLENLLLDERGDLKLTDFGCCCHDKDERKTFCGTLEYISPQMAQKIKYDNKVDVYCAGIVLYELFYGESPFKAQTQGQTLKNIEIGSIHFNEHIRVIPNPARDLIIQMLSKEPSKRPTAQQVLEHQFFKYYYQGPRYNPKELQIKEQIKQSSQSEQVMYEI